MKLIKCIHTQSKCYKRNSNVKPIGIVVHSTGSNNTTIKRYAQPSTDDPNRQELLNIIGTNKYNNHWNKSNATKAVHYFVGEIADGSIATVQTLPEYMEPYGCGKGSKGSYNYNSYTHIQFEICEDNLKNADYFRAIYKEATELCADICQRYGWNVSVIVSHKEAHAKGYASNHRDIDHWLANFGKTMNNFRADVQAILDANKPEPEPTPIEPEGEPYVPAINEIVNYIGTVHYSNANSTTAKTCKPGEATCTRTYNGKHPYHLVNTAGDKEGVYGWVDAEFIVKYEAPKEEDKPAVEVVPEPTPVVPKPEPAPEIKEDPVPTIDPEFTITPVEPTPAPKKKWYIQLFEFILNLIKKVMKK